MVKILLLGLGGMVKKVYTVAADKDRNFKELISSRSIALVVRTGKAGEAVQYGLKDGRPYHNTEDHTDPDLAITIPGTASLALMLLKPTPKMLIKSVMNAIIKDDLTIEFKPEPLMWAVLTTRHLPGIFLPGLKKKTKSSKKRR